jgi:hypothetical protein
MSLTLKGKIASQIREIHCLVFAELFENKAMEHLTAKQLISLFSCFTNVSVQEEFKDFNVCSPDEDVNKIITTLSESYIAFQEQETYLGISTGIDYNIHYDLLNYVGDWCDAESVEECKLVLQRLGEEKGIFLGEFVKALLKINNISNEMEKIAELTGNIAFLSKLKEIPVMTLKYVVTNQSLYV